MGLILLVAALICFILSAINVGSPRVNLQSAGLACWVASQLLGIVS